MSKLTKNELKSIVKECLIEILAEGLTSNRQSTISERKQLKSTINNSIKESAQNKSRFSYLDNIHINQQRKSETKQHLENVQQKASNVTKDPVMSAIFADTAMTTLREQKENNRSSGPSIMSSGDQAAKIVDQASPTDLFGDQAAKWADLAFSDPIRKS